MNKVGRVSFIAVALIVVLRIAIGWQLFYEGVWKIKTLKSPTPWTAAGYLKNSQGPLRGMFRNMAGDPDDLDWLDADKVTAKWDAWQKRFGSHYKLSAPQISRLNQLVNGSEVIVAKLDSLPDGVDLDSVKREVFDDNGRRLKEKGKTVTTPIVTYDAEKQRLSVSGRERMHPTEKRKLLAPVTTLPEDVTSFVSAIETLYEKSRSIVSENRPDRISTKLLSDLPEGLNLASVVTTIGDDQNVQLVEYDAEAKVISMPGSIEMTLEQKQAITSPLTSLPKDIQTFVDAVEILYKRSSNLSFKQRARAMLNGNADLVGDQKLQRLGEMNEYKSMLASHERQLANAKTDYQYDHLSKLWKDVQAKRASLVGPIKALDADLKKAAQELLTLEQLELGAAPKPWTSLRISDTLTIVGLACLGLMLICGLFTRFAAASAAFMLFSFYMAMPPLPGLPELPGPEHSLIVNKNLIEVFALAAIAALPTGMWFGLDSFIAWFFAGSKEN